VQGGQLAQLVVADVVTDRGDRRGAPVAVADRGDGLALLLQLDHRPGVLHRARQRLLAQHVLARRPTSASAIGRCSALPTTMLTASIDGSSATASQLGSAFS
jgi:hypothetical protein